MDGLQIFAQACKDLKVDVMGMIAVTARWVDPATFTMLPVWYPEYARKAPMYKANWVDRQRNTSRTTGATTDKFEANERAATTLDKALGNVLGDNWTCCHIWGIDDTAFTQPNVIVQNPMYYSCVANMVALPTPLKAMTDSMPEVKYALRFCAYHLYGWYCPDPVVKRDADRILAGAMPINYPALWPTADRKIKPPGTVALNTQIRNAAQTRISEIRENIANRAMVHYPRESVRSVLNHYKIAV